MSGGEEVTFAPAAPASVSAGNGARLFRSMAVRSVLPSSFFSSGFLRGADPRPQSGSRTRMEPSSRGGCASLAGFRALVEQAETGFRIVVWNP